MSNMKEMKKGMNKGMMRGKMVKNKYPIPNQNQNKKKTHKGHKNLIK